MNKYIKLLSVCALVLSVASCEDPLSTKVAKSYPSEDTWRVHDKAKGVLYNAYAAMGNQIDAYSNNFLDVVTADAVTCNTDSDVYKLSQGALSPTVNPMDVWSLAYAQFQNIHMFLENGLSDNTKYHKDTATDLKWKRMLKGEAHFLRAWWGWQLLKNFGGRTDDGKALGYPIVLSSGEGYEMMPRDGYEDCVEQIIADLDTAMEYLPKTQDESPEAGTARAGKASINSSLSLKAIVYLYAASDAYQPDGITEGEREYKWIRAAYAADKAIEKIGKPKPLSKESFGGVNSNVDGEFILAQSSGNNANYEKRNYPPYYRGQAWTNPSQNLVDAFPMANGFPIDDPRSLYDPADPYKGRDSRFYLDILYNGAEFKGSTIDVFDGGKDSYSNDVRASKTGYYIGKWVSDIVNLVPGSWVTSNRHYAIMRKTEVWMAFAEAANQAWGPTSVDATYIKSGRTAYDALKTIREGAGITDTGYLDEVAALGKDEFDDLVMSERRVEFCFENQRLYDLRRKMQMEPLSEDVYGMSVTLVPEGGFEYESMVIEHRYLGDDKYIYNPIPYSEMSKNPLLKQNAGWN